MGSRSHADASPTPPPPPPTPPASASASAPGQAALPLSFGVERILSGAFPRRRPHSPPPLLPPPPPPHCPTVVAPTPGFGVPCAECVSSLLRCCRLSDAAHQHHHHHQQQHQQHHRLQHQHQHQHHQQPAYTVHSPRPIRPYTNMLQLSEGHGSPSAVPGGLHVHAGAVGGGGGGGGGGAGAAGSGGAAGGGKRKRSWSRAVFSNLQRKGLEKRFQLQKYITKPDRRQLAATLGLTDAQVKVWFQNRRMKWRHSREAKAAPAPAAPTAPATGDAAVDSTQRDLPEGDAGAGADAELVDVQALDSG